MGAAGPVDRVQIIFFRVVATETGDEPVVAGVGDFDLDVLATRRPRRDLLAVTGV